MIHRLSPSLAIAMDLPKIMMTLDITALPQFGKGLLTFFIVTHIINDCGFIIRCKSQCHIRVNTLCHY